MELRIETVHRVHSIPGWSSLRPAGLSAATALVRMPSSVMCNRSVSGNRFKARGSKFRSFCLPALAIVCSLAYYDLLPLLLFSTLSFCMLGVCRTAFGNCVRISESVARWLSFRLLFLSVLFVGWLFFWLCEVAASAVDAELSQVRITTCALNACKIGGRRQPAGLVNFSG